MNNNAKSFNDIIYLNKSRLFHKLKIQKQKMKLSCLESCLNFEDDVLLTEEKECLTNCRAKVDEFLRYSDELYKTKYFQS